jgi:hypothetical protein
MFKIEKIRNSLLLKAGLALGIIVIISLLPIMSAFTSSNYSIDQPYTYPIEPGTNAWAETGNHAARVQACQIPEDILGNMTTEALLETVLAYPHLLDMYAYDNTQYGFKRVTAGFNGLQELLDRKDAGSATLAKYRSMDPAGIQESWTNIEKGEYLFSFACIEILLAQDSVLRNFTESELKELLSVVTTKAEEMQNTKYQWTASKETNTLLVGRILIAVDYKPFLQAVEAETVINMFTAGNYFIPYETVVDEIISYAEQFLKTDSDVR